MDNYPQAVKEYVDDLAEGLSSTGFFVDYEIDPEIGTALFKEEISPAVFRHWIDEGIPGFGEEDLRKALRMTTARSTVESLKRKGFVDTYVDENGKEHIFLTSTNAQ